MGNKPLEGGQSEDLSKHIRIVRFYIDHVAIVGKLDYRKYFAEIKADVKAVNNVIHYNKTIEFRFDLECDDEVDVCSEFKYEGNEISFEDYTDDINEIKKQIKKKYNL